MHPKLTKNIIDEMGEDTLDKVINRFNEYLMKLSDHIIEKCELDMMKVIMNQDNPLRVKGWSPILVIHFDQYIKEALAKEEEKV